MTSHPHVAVIGAGVSGLTTALVLARSGARVTVVARTHRRPITSHAAAAFWYPFHVSRHPNSALNAPAAETLAQLSRISSDAGSYSHGSWSRPYLGPNSGVAWSIAHEYFEDATTDPGSAMGRRAGDAYFRDEAAFWWRGLPGVDLRRLEDSELPPPLESHWYPAGIRFNTIIVKPTEYLASLAREVERLGGTIGLMPVVSLDDLIESFPRLDAIINCGGANAPDVLPQSLADTESELEWEVGHVVIVDPIPDADRIIFVHKTTSSRLTYVVPRRVGSDPDILLGGTTLSRRPTKFDDRMPEIDYEQVKGIVARCANFVPGLSQAGIRRVMTGRRPIRDAGVRMEIQQFHGIPVVQNYGHGGAGYTLSWGCALWVRRALIEVDVLASL